MRSKLAQLLRICVKLNLKELKHYFIYKFLTTWKIEMFCIFQQNKIIVI